MAAETFQFRHAVFTIRVDLDDERIEVRGGMRSQVAPVPRLEHLHVKVDRRGDQQELLLSWRTARGNLKRLRIFSDYAEPGFDGLVAALLVRRPDIDRRHLSAREVYRLAGSRELDWAVLPSIMLLGWVVLAVLFVPLIRHGLDGGHATVAVEALVAGPPPASRNLTVLGRPLLDHSLQGEAAGDRRGTAGTRWVPLVPETWKAGDPVPAVLEVRGFKEDPEQFAARRAFPAVLRDLAWEGLSTQRKRALEERGIVLAAHIKLLEHGADAKHDLYLAVGVLGLLGLLTAVVFVVLWRRRPPRLNPGQPAGRP